jgi:hypothetical protein
VLTIGLSSEGYGESGKGNIRKSIMKIADMFWVLLRTHFVGTVEIVTQPCNEVIFVDAIDLAMELRENILPPLSKWRDHFVEKFSTENIRAIGGKQCRITIDLGVQCELRLLGVENGSKGSDE